MSERVTDFDWAATVAQGIAQLNEPVVHLPDRLYTLHGEHVDGV